MVALGPHFYLARAHRSGLFTARSGEHLPTRVSVILHPLPLSVLFTCRTCFTHMAVNSYKSRSRLLLQYNSSVFLLPLPMFFRRYSCIPDGRNSGDHLMYLFYRKKQAPKNDVTRFTQVVRIPNS